MTGAAPERSRVEIATSVEHAVQLMAGLGPDGAFLAGGTALMRHPAPPATWVALHRLAALRQVTSGERHTWGAMLTHTGLAGLDLPPALRALGTAARSSAFPQVRNVATLGGNVSARGFAEADLLPALLVLDATVTVAGPGGQAVRPLPEYLPVPTEPTLLLSVTAPATPDRVSGYGRLIVRAAGEYPICCVALSARRDITGRVAGVRVAVGAVEARARRVPQAEEVLEGSRLEAAAVRAAAAAAAAALTARDDTLAPGWYRLAVLPTVLARAAADLDGRAGPSTG